MCCSSLQTHTHTHTQVLKIYKIVTIAILCNSHHCISASVFKWLLLTKGHSKRKQLHSILITTVMFVKVLDSLELWFMFVALPESLPASPWERHSRDNVILPFCFIYLSIYLLYNIVLVSPYIDMNLPRVYTCSPSWTSLPPPSPSHPSGSSQCTSPEHPVSCIEPGLVIRFTYDNIHGSMSFSQIIPPLLSPTKSKRLFYTSVSLLLSRIQGYRYHLSKFHMYVLAYCIGVFLSGLLHSE